MARKARKIKDKWKEKKWVTVIAPDAFNDISIGYIKPEESYVELPTEPGIGIGIDEKKLTNYPYKKFPTRKIRDLDDEIQWH